MSSKCICFIYLFFVLTKECQWLISYNFLPLVFFSSLLCIVFMHFGSIQRINLHLLCKADKYRGALRTQGRRRSKKSIFAMSYRPASLLNTGSQKTLYRQEIWQFYLWTVNTGSSALTLLKCTKAKTHSDLKLLKVFSDIRCSSSTILFQFSTYPFAKVTTVEWRDKVKTTAALE